MAARAQLTEGEMIFDSVFEEPLPANTNADQAPWEDMALAA